MLLSYVSPWPFFWTSLAPFATPFSSTPPVVVWPFFDHESMRALDDNMNPKWPNMVHILEPKASQVGKNATLFQYFHFWTMSQFGRHMSLHGHFCGPVWHHLGPLFVPPLPPPPQAFSTFSITIPHWSFLKHLRPSGGHLGQMWCPTWLHFSPSWAILDPLGTYLE